MYVPYNLDNAITYVAFGWKFDNEFPQEFFDNISDVTHSWQHDLPAKTLLFKPGILARNSEELAKDHTIVGIEYSFQKPDGVPELSLQILNSHIELRFNNYTRWTKIQSKMHQILMEVLMFINKNSESVVESSNLVIQNKFFCTGKNNSNCDLRKLLKSNFIESIGYAYTSANWDSTIDWTEENKMGKLNSKLNVKSIFNENDNKENLLKRMVEINVDQIFRFKNDSLPIKKFLEQNGKLMLDNFEKMHQLNKKLILSLITDKMANTIGLST